MDRACDLAAACDEIERLRAALRAEQATRDHWDTCLTCKVAPCAVCDTLDARADALRRAALGKATPGACETK